MDCVASSSKQQLIIHPIDSAGDHQWCIWNPGSEGMKDVGIVSVNPMFCMTWTQTPDNFFKAAVFIEFVLTKRMPS